MTTGRRIVSVAIACLVGFGLSLAPAHAATTKFTNCDKMHKVYPYGISKSSKAQARAVREGMFKPPVRAQAYEDSYKTLDRDKDGTMCEVPR